MPDIARKPLELKGAPKLRYTPLPALSVADYIDDYAERLNKTGVLDHLSLMGAGIDLADARRGDLAAIGVLGTSFVKMFSSDGGAERRRLAEIVLDHCTRFAVQVKDEAADEWINIDSADAYNAHLGAEHMVDLIRELGVEALRPLWNRLASTDEAGLSESPKSSPDAAASV